MPAQATAIPLAAAGSGAVVANTCTLRGFWLVTSAAAVITIYDNASAASGTVLAQWTGTVAGDKEFDFADGVRCVNGIYVNVASGTVTGHIRIG
jgi:hypothetical protein